ncbi:hypothetical protein LXL04_001632 [Taraxacum kok-saghyz]
MNFAELLSPNAANNVKAPKRLRPKPKPQPQPKSTPTPPPQPTNNEIITRTEEEQTVEINQISENTNNDWQSSFEKPHEENAEPFITLESLNDILPQSTTVAGDSPPVTVTETQTNYVSVDGNVENGKGPTEADLESFAQIDPLTGDEASIFNDNQDFQIENLSSVSNDAENSHFWEPLDMSAGPKVEKFKPKAPTRKVENISSEMDYMDNESVPMFSPDELLGSSYNGITDSIPVPDFHVNEEQPPMSQVDSGIRSEHLDAIPETPSLGHESVKKGKRQSPGRSSERLRRQSKKTHALVDEPDNDGIGDEIIHGSEDINNNNMPENEPVIEKKGRKSKKAVNDKEKEKPVRKRKKASEEESTKVKKRFPHGTRRNRRPVDPELLKIPEDQLEFHMHTIPMKELIRLAEYKERIAKKEASTSGTPALHQRYDQDEETGSGDEYNNISEAQNATYYNYRTHMKITPRMRWSKQDTELFYEAIQQFGTDLSMIKECFPGRTREQIKSKYKKEEKQHPLRLNDALTTRFKGNSHFEGVIQRLKEAQAEDYENEDPINLTGEDDVAPDINLQEDGGESRKDLEAEKKEEEMEVANGSPTKSHESEDDMFRWSQYKSDDI